MIRQNNLSLRFISHILPILFLIFLFNSAFGATFTVTKTEDTNDGICDSDCSLREAIVAANAVGSDDQINFSSNLFGNIQSILTNTEFTIINNGKLSINGTGSHLLQLRGFNNYQPSLQRIFYIAPGADVTLSDLYISQGGAGGAVKSGFGGAILNDNAVLKVNNCQIYSNLYATGGAAIYNDSGTVNINNSAFLNNQTYGGVIENNQGTIIVRDTEILYNNGSGIKNSGNLTVENSTFLFNFSFYKGGGILNTGIAKVTNSTFNANTANERGGAIYNSSSLALESSTIFHNGAREISNIAGGGISNESGGSVTAHNTIIAGNINNDPYTFDGSNSAPSDYAGTLDSLGYNLIQNTSQAIITGITTGNILDTVPQLSYIAGEFGGATSTLALKINSPAIDAGDPNNFPNTDQRGFSRPQDGDANGSFLPDIGAYETTRITEPSTFTVKNINDSGEGSLRNAVETANATYGDDTINFDPAVFNSPKTITLQNWGIKIASGSNLTINGPGADLLKITTKKQNNVITLDAYDAIAVLNNATISEGIIGIYNLGNLTLNDSVVEYNSASDRIPTSGFYSTGIYSQRHVLASKMNINNSIVRYNKASQTGSGIRINKSDVNINNSTISDNELLGGQNGNCGVGIEVRNSILNVKNSTISRNKSLLSAEGGGICASWASNINLDNVTIAENKAGGGIWMSSGATMNISNSTIAQNYGIGIQTNGQTINSKNSIIAKNTSGDVWGAMNSQGYNLILHTTNATITGIETGNIFGVDPQFNSKGLQNNGGQTETIALLPTSPAIDKGNPNDFPLTDQRGFSRPRDGDGNGSVLPDIGAFELQNKSGKNSVLFDFDGDGKSDISVFRPSNGAWYIQRSASGFTGVTFGADGDLLAPADFDGDGKTDVSVFRPSDGGWYRVNSSTNTFYGATFGANGDLPRPADFDGDGKADISVFRPSNGSWYRLNSSNNSFYGVAFGANGDKPLIADFDGDGKSDIAVFRPSTGAFYSLDSTTGAFRGVAFGLGTDIPTLGDYDGDGKTDVAVFRPSDGGWYRVNSSTNSFYGLTFGANGDIPAAADYDGDGKTDVAVFRPSAGAWYRLNSTNGGFYGESFGAGTDKPVPAAFLQ